MSDNAKSMILEYGVEGSRLRDQFFKQSADTILEAARAMAIALAQGGKILLCGNGGSAADAQHLAAEFVGRFIMERPPLPAIALTTDTSALTAIGNDYSFDEIFARQVQALGAPGDVLVGISTSGTSSNVLQALNVARERNMVTVGLTGTTGGDMEPLCRHLIKAPEKAACYIQEMHIAAEHMMCRLVDYFLFEAVTELQPYLAAPE